MQRSTALLARHARRRFATTSTLRRRFATTSTLYVDGAAAAASDSATIKTSSPADGSVLAELSDASADDARRAVAAAAPVSYTHLRAHETPEHLVCRLLLEKKK